jgi:hypothetical protein
LEELLTGSVAMLREHPIHGPFVTAVETTCVAVEVD